MNTKKATRNKPQVVDTLGNMVPVFFEENPEPSPGNWPEIVGMHLGPRTKLDHPYTYDPILQFASGIQPNGSLYTDRLKLWYDYKVLKAAMQRHFGDESDYFDRRPVTKIQDFLRDLMGSPKLVITRIEEHCNQSNGYPCWFIAYHEPKAEVIDA
jgi:hypothetical protein